LSLPYGSASRNQRGDTPLRGRSGLPCAAAPDYTTMNSPGNYAARNSYLQANRNLRFGNQSRFRRVVTFRRNLTELPSR